MKIMPRTHPHMNAQCIKAGSLEQGKDISLYEIQEKKTKSDNYLLEMGMVGMPVSKPVSNQVLTKQNSQLMPGPF